MSDFTDYDDARKEVIAEDGMTKICPQCHGQGGMPDEEQCGVCGGSGEVPAHNPKARAGIK